MNIATSLNRKYVDYTYVMMKSVLMNNKDEDICFYILHSELNEEDTKKLRTLTDEYNQKAVFLKIDRAMFSDKLPTTELWSMETYFRLMLLDLLPDEVDRILYLDVDVIVDKSISDLYNTDFEEQLFAVCKEMPFDGKFRDGRQKLFGELFDAGYQYFNAGVMLWNIAKLRNEDYNFEKYMKLAADINYAMCAPDQDLLNLMHHDRLVYVDECRYDLFARFAHSHGVTYEDVKRETVIVHFPGYKPWSGEFVHFDIEKIWWEYAKETPMYYELLEDYLNTSLEDNVTETMINNIENDKNRLNDECIKMAEMLKKLVKV